MSRPVTWRRDGPILVAFVLGVNVLGGLPAFFVPTDTTWIERPLFYPPEVLFPVVWTLLFSLMGVSLFLVWRRGIGNRAVQVALGVFSIQMALNLVWTPVFFGLQRPDLGLLVIAILWMAIVATIASFHRISRLAAGLLVPYLVWVTFAMALNFSIYTAWAPTGVLVI